MNAPNNPTDRKRCLIEGRKRKDAGMALAALPKQLEVWKGQLALLRAIKANPGRTATTDDTVADLSHEFADAGKWRGQITAGLSRIRLIRRVGFIDSARPSRHSGPVAVWQGIDDTLTDGFIQHLESIIQVVPTQPSNEKQRDLFDEPEPLDIKPAIDEVLRRVNAVPPADAPPVQEKQEGGQA